MKQGRSGPIVVVTLATFALIFALWSNVTAQTARDVAREAFPSVVMIVAPQAKGKTVSLGSGFVVRPGVVATNYHVIKGSASLYVKLIRQDQSYAVAKPLSVDPNRDLALLIVNELDAPALSLADGSELEVGDRVYAIGNPEGLEGTLSEGIVSGIRDLDGQQYIQITAAISHGSSGGPVVNANGKVVGLAVGSVETGQDLNFAIPASYLAELIAKAEGAEDAEAPSLIAEPDRKPSSAARPRTELPSGSPYLDQEERAELSKARQALRRKPASATAHLDLAKVYRQSRMYSESIKEYKEALRLRPDYFEAYLRLGDCYAEVASFFWDESGNKYHEAAAKNYEQALRLKPTSTEAVLGLGEAYSGMLRQEDALQMFKLAISIKADYDEAYYEMGEAYRLIGFDQKIRSAELPRDEWRKSYGLAIEAYKKAVAINPSNSTAWCQVGSVYKELGRDDQAISSFIGAVANGNPYCADDLISLYKAHGKMREALGAAEKLASTSPNNGAAHFLLGCVYLEVGDEKRALGEYTLLKQRGTAVPKDELAQRELLASRLFDRIYK